MPVSAPPKNCHRIPASSGPISSQSTLFCWTANDKTHSQNLELSLKWPRPRPKQPTIAKDPRGDEMTGLQDVRPQIVSILYSLGLRHTRGSTILACWRFIKGVPDCADGLQRGRVKINNSVLKFDSGVSPTNIRFHYYEQWSRIFG